MQPNEHFAPPPGPPPNYTAPPGPPPSHQKTQKTYEAPAPEEAPPSYEEAPLHDWQNAVPDNSIGPPPPAVENSSSRTNNASSDAAEQGADWCNRHRLCQQNIHFSQDAFRAADRGDIGLNKPRSYCGKLSRLGNGLWQGETTYDKSNWKNDCCMTSAIPMYSFYQHSLERVKTIYYEVQIQKLYRQEEVGLALGFAAPPYPTFRQPGWHRASLAIHGDDGSKFINEADGGRDCTSPFREGDRVGIGMTFTAKPSTEPPPYNGMTQPAYMSGPPQPADVEVFFTRNGKRQESWDLHETRDIGDGASPVMGLEGLHDIYAAVGTFCTGDEQPSRLRRTGMDFRILFNREDWQYALPTA